MRQRRALRSITVENSDFSAACIWAADGRRAAGRAGKSNAAAATSDNSDVELIRAVGGQEGGCGWSRPRAAAEDA